VKPGDVVVLAYCPTVAAAAEQSPTPAELERIEAIFDRLAAPARQLAELFDKRAWVGQAEAADALDEIQEALLDLAHWQFKRSGQGELPL
jgi:hypothetical protein